MEVHAVDMDHKLSEHSDVMWEYAMSVVLSRFMLKMWRILRPMNIQEYHKYESALMSTDFYPRLKADIEMLRVSLPAGAEKCSLYDEGQKKLAIYSAEVAYHDVFDVKVFESPFDPTL